MVRCAVCCTTFAFECRSHTRTRTRAHSELTLVHTPSALVQKRTNLVCHTTIRECALAAHLPDGSIYMHRNESRVPRNEHIYAGILGVFWLQHSAALRSRMAAYYRA